MSKEEEDRITNEILNNISCKLEFKGEEYYLLLKKQQTGSHCLLFLTDYCANFWLKKINILFLTDLRTEMKVKTDLKIFAEHLAYGLKELCQIKQMSPFPVLLIKMRIGDGLVMNCRMKLDNLVNLEQKTQRFKSILKVFGKQLYDARSFELKSIQKPAPLSKPEESPQGKLRQDELVLQGKLFTRPEMKIIPGKHRDLINPLRKKRKRQGIKIGKESSQSQSESQNES